VLALALTVAALAAPLPDLDQATPFGLSVVHHDDRSLLVFGSAVDNVGPGDLVVEGRRWGAELRTWQVIGSRRLPLPVRLVYVRAETHRHWHFPGFERYELRSQAGRTVGRDRKSGFCLRDAYETRSRGRPPRFTGECRPGHPDATTIREGISPGFGDDYVPEKEGQSIDITGLASGRYVLVHSTNPDGVLHERSYVNNEASVLLRLQGARVTVLRRCPASAACGT
jgi:Lysyl oxidase